MIAPRLRWDHSEDRFVMKFEVKRVGDSGERKVKLSLEEYKDISGHVIDGTTTTCILFLFFKLNIQHFMYSL